MIDQGLNGYIVEPKQAEEIAERVIELIDNENLLRKMSLNARSKAEYFSVEKYVDNILNIYEQVRVKTKQEG